MSEFIHTVREASDGSLAGVSDAVILALIVVGGSIGDRIDRGTCHLDFPCDPLCKI